MRKWTAQEPADLRVRRTHKLLWEALLALMTERDFDTINVSEICDRAMVHRTTFYKHYDDKYDLLERGMQQTHETLIEEIEQAGKGPSQDSTPFFAYIAAHEQFYRVMLCGKGVASFQERLRNHFVETIASEMRRLERTGKAYPVPQPLLAHFYAGAIVSTLAWWLSNGLPYTPEQMGQYMSSLLGEAPPGRIGDINQARS